MKKITLALVLLTFGAQAQPFPSPYCEITDANDVSVEEITSVDFAGTSITNTNATSVLIDETATAIIVAHNGTYSIEVEGNTYGNFDTDIVAFIDWNQNDVLDDTGEIYSIGTLTNTDGSDGASVSMDITVPIDAVLGSTRIRITKTYKDPNSPAEIDPCGILFNPFGMGIFPGFGQALDFTLNIEALSVDSFDINALSVYPIPTEGILNINYKSPLSSVKVYNLLGQELLEQQRATSRLQLDLSSFTSGVYIVKIFTEEGQHSFRVLKE